MTLAERKAAQRAETLQALHSLRNREMLKSARAWLWASSQTSRQPVELRTSLGAGSCPKLTPAFALGRIPGKLRCRTWGTVVPGVLAGSDEDMDDVLAMLATALLVSGLARWGRAAAELHTNVRDDSMKPVFGTGSLPAEYPYEVLKLLTWVRIPLFRQSLGESPAGHVTRFRVGMTKCRGPEIALGMAGTSAVCRSHEQRSCRTKPEAFRLSVEFWVGTVVVSSMSCSADSLPARPGVRP